MPLIPGGRGRRISEFKASLIYTVNSTQDYILWTLSKERKSEFLFYFVAVLDPGLSTRQALCHRAKLRKKNTILHFFAYMSGSQDNFGTLVLLPPLGSQDQTQVVSLGYKVPLLAEPTCLPGKKKLGLPLLYVYTVFGYAKSECQEHFGVALPIGLIFFF